MKLWQGNVFTLVCDSVHRGGLCPSIHHRSHDQGGLCPEGSLSRGISVQGDFCLGGLCPGGLCRGGLCLGDLCPEGSLSMTETPPYERVVRILLEWIPIF